jgi:hypothetical protein
MRREAESPFLRQPMLSILTVILTAVGYRRWLSHPWQWSLKDYMIVVAACSAVFLACLCPAPMIAYLAVLAVAVAACLSLPRHGFRFVDLATVLAILLLTAALVLPAMERAWVRSLGKSYFPFSTPRRIVDLYSLAE